MWEVASPTRQIHSRHHDLPMANVRLRTAEHLDSIANDTVVACYPRKSVEALAGNNPKIGLQVQAMARRGLTYAGTDPDPGTNHGARKSRRIPA